MDLLYVEFENLQEVASRYDRAVSLLRTMTAAEDIKNIYVEAMRDAAPERSGELKGDIDGRVVYLPDNAFDIEVFTRSKLYTKWVIGGRGWVYPKRAKVLHWVSPSGEDVFAAYARPVPPNRFHERAYNAVKPRVRERWRQMGEMVAHVLAD